MKNWKSLALVVGLVVAGLFGFARAGGGGTQWFDWLGFEGWPNGVHVEISELTDEGVGVSITSGEEGGTFIVGDSGWAEFGQRSLLADKHGILLTFHDSLTGRGAREFVFSTRASGGTPQVFCWTNAEQVGDFSRIFQVAKGNRNYVNVGFTPEMDARLNACMAINCALDQIVIRR